MTLQGFKTLQELDARLEQDLHDLKYIARATYVDHIARCLREARLWIEEKLRENGNNT